MITLESLRQQISELERMNNLESLKPSYHIIMVEMCHGGANIGFDTVSSISKTGRVTTETGIIFKSNGVQYGGNIWCSSKYLVEYNDDNIELVKKYKSMIRMSRYITDNLKPDKLDFETMKTVWLIAQEQDSKCEVKEQ